MIRQSLSPSAFFWAARPFTGVNHRNDYFWCFITNPVCIIHFNHANMSPVSNKYNWIFPFILQSSSCATWLFILAAWCQNYSHVKELNCLFRWNPHVVASDHCCQTPEGQVVHQKSNYRANEWGLLPDSYRMRRDYMLTNHLFPVKRMLTTMFSVRLLSSFYFDWALRGVRCQREKLLVKLGQLFSGLHLLWQENKNVFGLKRDESRWRASNLSRGVINNPPIGYRSTRLRLKTTKSHYTFRSFAFCIKAELEQIAVTYLFFVRQPNTCDQTKEDERWRPPKGGVRLQESLRMPPSACEKTQSCLFPFIHLKLWVEHELYYKKQPAAYLF